jgi:hypothetical protein
VSCYSNYIFLNFSLNKDLYFLILKIVSILYSLFKKTYYLINFNKTLNRKVKVNKKRSMSFK